MKTKIVVFALAIILIAIILAQTPTVGKINNTAVKTEYYYDSIPFLDYGEFVVFEAPFETGLIYLWNDECPTATGWSIYASGIFWFSTSKNLVIRLTDQGSNIIGAKSKRLDGSNGVGDRINVSCYNDSIYIANQLTGESYWWMVTP
jgi:hypothetical protein